MPRVAVRRARVRRDRVRRARRARRAAVSSKTSAGAKDKIRLGPVVRVWAGLRVRSTDWTKMSELG